MPIYEYLCLDCRKKTAVFLRSMSEKPDPKCSHCNGNNLHRLFSRFATTKSDEARLERMADPSAWGGVDENDPKSVADFTRRMTREMGDEFRGEMGDHFEEMVDQEMSGRNSGGQGSDESDPGAGQTGGMDSGSDAGADSGDGDG